MSEITYRVPLEDGSVANTVGPRLVIEAMYPVGAEDAPGVYVGDARADHTGITMQPVNSALRFTDLQDGRRAILGNTVTRNCPVAKDCGSCALAGTGLSIEAMAARNCARANTASVFEVAEQDPRGRFVLLPTSTESYVVDDTSFTSEYNGTELMQNRLKPAYAVVFTESWLRERGLEQVTFAGNGADGSVGVATTTPVDGERLIIPFFSLRQNMGDREEKDQILRQALNAFFDSREYDEAKRQEVLSKLEVSVSLAASASLKYFAHKIKVPGEDPEASEWERNEAARIRGRYPDLIRRAGNKITSAIVLNDQYPGAMARKNIYPELEAQLGIHETPITPDNCPGDGQSCHIDYRAETEYALVGQLRAMGVPEGNIHYDDSQALDPADPSNNMASNRAEQNNGVAPAGNTNRTLNAMRVRLNKQFDTECKDVAGITVMLYDI